VLGRKINPTSTPPTMTLTLWRVRSYPVATAAGSSTATVTLELAGNQMIANTIGTGSATATCAIL
jgi:hypothetical protein